MADPTLIESPDSSSPSVTRAVAAGLRGEYSQSFVVAAWQRPVLKLLGALPQGAARYALSRFNSLGGVDPQKVQSLQLSQLIGQRLEDYRNNRGPFQAVVTGAAMGGASAHLSLALGGPFLPQAFVLTLKGGSKDGNAEKYLNISKNLALRVAKNNPGCITVQHYDPIHDEWVVRYANHLRMKLTSLPQEYAEFLRQNLVPGGSIVFLNSQARWLRYRLGERSYIQVGGWGDISPQEFLDGSERISRFCREVGYQFDHWRLDGYQLEEGPESEWGCEPGLALALEEFCNREGYRLVRISLPDPFDYSKLAFRVIEHQLSQAGCEPAGVLIECFGQFDATAVLRAGLLPVWLVFNTLDNLGYLESVRPQFPKGKPVFFSPLMTFSFAPDRVPWEEWERALAGLEWINIGPRASHYPADPWVILSWAEPLRRWVKENGIPALPLVTAEKLLEISKGL